MGYIIAPRLNAAGRIASADKSIELLLETDYAKADILAKELCEINRIRQNTEQSIYDEAIQQIGQYRGDRFSYILHSETGIRAWLGCWQNCRKILPSRHTFSSTGNGKRAEGR